MSSRSSSSSSDILGPAGDSEYLLSSPTKPPGGRQHFMSMSPAPNFKFLQTPGSVKGKRQRTSLSPSKSAHSIRFDDVLLPATPALAKLAGGQPMSLSPEKDQGESGNPWRIRVTLEATQDEENEGNNQKSPTRRVLYPSTTMTTKVPLKDERDQPEPTPRRRRGRPRKTEIQALPDATPTQASPGHTPGAKGANGQSRPRGRPRKGTPVPVERHVEEQPTPALPEQSSPLNLEQPTPVPVPGRQRSSQLNFGEEEQPTPASVPDQQRYDPFNLESEDQPTPGPEFEQRSSPLNFEQPTTSPDSRRERHSPLNLGVEEQPNPDSELHQERYSPLNLGADGDSEDDELPDAPLPAYDFQEEDETMRPDPTDWNRSSPRVTFAEPAYETPDVGAIDRDDDDGKLHSTPSKMPSSIRQGSIQEPLNSSPANTVNAGRTPRPPPRLYPTPTSSSLVDEENHEQDNLDEEVPSSDPHDTQGEATDHPSDDYGDPADEHRDPTDEHREYDSIVESEGFSMVSLDTLPSAKQHGISTNSDRIKGPLRPFLQRESIGREKTKRKASSMGSDHNENAHANASSNPEPINEPPRKRQSRSPPKRQSRSPAHRRRPGHPATHDEAFEQRAPPSPPAEPTAPTPADNRLRPISRLAKIVRAGMVLEGAFRQNPEVEERPDRKIAIEEPKKRLESVFSDFDYDTQQQLRAGLGLGQEIAKKKIQAEIERERAEQEEASRNAAAHDTYDQDQYEDERPEEEEEDTSETPRQQGQRSVQDTPGPETAMRRRMAEWQQERESISREIDKANSSQVIVINSDDEASRSPERSRAYPGFDVGGPDSDSGSDFNQGPELEPGSEGNLPEDEAGHPDEEYEANKVGEEQEDAQVEEQEEYEGEELYPQQPHMQQPEEEEEQYAREQEDDDGYSDIWQQEAQEHSQISHQSSMHQGSMRQSSIRRDEDDARYRQESSPLKDDRSAAPSEYGAFSPAPWTHQREKVPYLGGQSRVRQLREQEVDLSMLLGASNTPNHSRYYYGRSSPLSTGSARPSQRAAPQFSPRYGENGVHGQEQPLSELGLVSSPLKHSDDDAFQVDPTTRIEHERMQHDRRRDQEEEDFEYSDAAVAEERFIVGNVEMTPQHPRPANPANPDVQGSTWFQRLASLTPGWLKAPISRSPARPSRVSEEYEDSDDDPVSDDGSAEDANAHPHGADGADVDEQDEIERTFRSSRRFTEWRQYEEPQSSPESRAAQQPDRAFSALGEESPVRSRPLAISGHFSNEHYIILRRLYRLATQFPERFTYYPAPGRDQIIGDWIWTSDGRHGVPVTEGQFAVIDQFVQELATGDLDSGGTGQIGWTEADLHRRLISVIIGEKIRAERKAKISGGDM
ncbi:putative AT DNA binding protein [Aspergillus chevalieri]|uniref:AT DNA binding protein n=1 Tax=Aspergillus chevalieri TaxID=182096 RepID=A0A7R7ZL38_ASPCH|nr:uncharacterized protein ACHE_20195S [Aspergillus chevalieri]BCR84737.1 hypothetical protein ACHE_20195S [Aspergillus chevalieri]